MPIRKVNLSEIQNSLSQRGRGSFEDAELLEAMKELVETGEPFIWESVEITGKTDKEISSSKAKWRHRAVSVFDSLNSGEKISVRFTDQNEMVILLKQ